MASGLMYPDDDYSYFAHASSLVYGQFPSYSKECFTVGDKRPAHGIGPGLMAAPFVFVFSLVDRIVGNPIVDVRKDDNIEKSWSVYGFVLSSVFYLWLGCFVLYKGLRRHFAEYETVLTIFLIVLCQGIPLFAFRRPVFSHVYEFSLMSILASGLLLFHEGWLVRARGWLLALALGLVTGLLVLVRPNNILMLLVWPPIFFIVQSAREPGAGAWKKILLAYGAAASLIAGFMLLPGLIESNSVYYEGARSALGSFGSPLFYLKRLWHMLVGGDWGLIYTAPFLLIGFIGALVFRFPLRKAVLISALPLLVNIYIIMAWRTQGGWYGYRYLVPAAIPVMAYPLALVLSKAGQYIGRRWVLLLCLIVCMLPLFSMLVFESVKQVLDMEYIQQYFGVSGWGNNEYQLNVWKALFLHPSIFWSALFRGVPLCLFACVSTLQQQPDHFFLGLSHYWQMWFALVFKVVLILCLPFLLTWLADLWSSRLNRDNLVRSTGAVVSRKKRKK